MLIPASLQRQAFRTLNRVVEPVVRAGIANPLPPLGAGLAVLETTGRRSGKTRSVPLVTARIGNRVYTSTVRPSSQWVANLAADPDATVWLNGRPRAVTATIRRGPLTVAELAID